MLGASFKLRDGLEVDRSGGRSLFSVEQGDSGEELGAGEGDLSTTGAAFVCSKPREAMSSTKEGKEAILCEILKGK